jgi:outer membrane protein assembly factor BamB
MKSKIILTIFILPVLALWLSACGSRSAMTAAGWAGVTTDGDSAYVSFNTHVVAVNTTNGTERWRYPLEADPKVTFYAPPTLTEDGRLIVGGYDNVLYSINPSSGQGTPIYEGAEGRFVGGILVTSENIFAPSADHFLYALDLNGNLRWKFETTEPLWAKPAIDPECNCVYLSAMDHRIYALEVQSGDVIWSTEELGGAIVGTPAVSDEGVLYVGTFAKEMLALDAVSGNVLWRFPTQDWVWGGPNLDANNLYFGDLSGTFYALERQSGVSRWQIQPEAGSSIVGTPLITDDGIYFTNETGSLVAVSPEGAIRWNQPLGTNLHSGPVQAGETILVATSNPETLLIAVDSNGVQRWSLSFEN